MLKKIKKAVLFVLHNIPTKKVTAQVCTLGETELLNERVALISGGTSGIGLEIAKAFLHSGAIVIITGRTQSKIDNIVQSLTSHKAQTRKDKVYGIEMNVRQPSYFKSKIREAEKLCQRKIDILVICAGVLGGAAARVNEEEYDAIEETNLKGPFFLTREYAKYLIGNKIEGNILNILSSSSFRPANSVYGVTKWGMRGFTEGMARSLAPYKIIVNAIAPGPTLTPMLSEDGDNNINRPNSLLGRLILPEEIASMAVIMCSKIGQPLLGQVLCMTGGSGNITNEDYNYSFD